jgi:serine/threonine protein kinase
MNGRIGDFGLSRLYDHGTDPQTTHMVGTMGYLAPELVRSGKASPSTDVFAFAILLLEITCAQRPVKQNAQGAQHTLMDWVLEHCHNGLLTETVDPRLRNDYNFIEACLVLNLGLLCSHPFISARPTMRQVMQYLEGDTQIPELTSTHFSFTMQALTQDKGFESPNMLHPPLTTSIGTFSSLSGGR